MELSLFEIWESMSLLSRLVAISLLGMGVASFAVIIERTWVLRRTDRESMQFAGNSRSQFADGDIVAVLELARRFTRNPLARLTAIGVQTFQAHESMDPGAAAELTRRELARKLELYSAEGRRGMGMLASIGSTAPFIGLFGTVIGIIVAFQGIASAGGGGIAAVSAGIAEALIVTAVGLIVAITSVLFFNYLSGRFDRLDMQMQHAAGELIDYLEGSHGHGGRDR